MYSLREYKWFLSIKVIRDRAAKKLYLLYNTYIKKIAKKFGLSKAKCLSTPLPSIKLKKHNKKPYPS